MTNNGAAFPFVAEYTVCDRRDMGEGLTVYATEVDGGMTLRDYFAAMALQGQIAAFSDERCRAYSVENSYEAGITPKEQVAVAAYEYADAMLKAREAK